MLKVERFKSMRLVHKNPGVAAVVLGVVRVADEDFLAGAEDVGATSGLAFAQRNLSVWEQDLSVKVVAAINGMKRTGHEAHLYKHQGKVWVEIDQCMLATFDEIEKLVDGVHSFEELEETFKMRHAEELGGV
jgi:serine/threonine-protein kinase RIO1